MKFFNSFKHLFVLSAVCLVFSPLMAQDTTLTITADGNVGIGTTTPSEKLVVGDDLGGSLGANRISIGNATGFSLLNLGSNLDNRSFIFWDNVNNYLGFGTRSQGVQYSQTMILKDGLTGMGRALPSARLHIASDGGYDTPQLWLQQTGADGFTRLRFSNPNDQWWGIAESPADQLRFYSATAGYDVMNLNSNGNVGIGNISPMAKLHVTGGLLLENTGPAVDRLILRTATFNDNSRYGIVFSNNTLAPFLGDDIGNQNFDFYSTWGNTRTYDAAINIHGKAEGSWGRKLGLTHDGTDGYINTDAGNIILYPENGAANVGIGTNVPAGKLDVNGTIYQRGGELHADYVFKDDYQLESIEEHAAFMWQEKHLKAIPKAAVDENGLEIVEVGAHRKGIVEELEKAHIYIDQLNERIKMLEEKLEKMAANQN
jgi:hypothetical protein